MKRSLLRTLVHIVYTHQVMASPSTGHMCNLFPMRTHFKKRRSFSIHRNVFRRKSETRLRVISSNSVFSSSFIQFFHECVSVHEHEANTIPPLHALRPVLGDWDTRECRACEYKERCSARCLLPEAFEERVNVLAGRHLASAWCLVLHVDGVVCPRHGAHGAGLAWKLERRNGKNT